LFEKSFTFVFLNHTFMALKIGITGGIGSGKTTVCHIFETLGIPIYYADDRAKALMVTDKKVIKSIISLFGTEAYLPDGSLNRQHIAQIAFHNPLILKELNNIVHPSVFRDGERWHKAQKFAPYTLKEAALLFESGSHTALDKIIAVYAPKELRIERVIARSGLNREEVESRMAKQLSDEEKMARADFVIYNDGTQLLLPQVMTIHKILTQ
jgi:dephospho-CoA kinase